MSTSNSNNSGNSNGNTIYIGAGGGGGTGANPYSGQYVTYVPNGFTFTIPITTQPVAASAAEKKKKSDGCNCKKCKEFFPYAEPNQEDGTLICYACRHGY